MGTNQSSDAIAVVNYSQGLSNHEIESVLCAINRQLAEHFIPMWRARDSRAPTVYNNWAEPITCHIHHPNFRRPRSNVDLATHESGATIMLVDTSTIRMALRYHWLNKARHSVGFVRVDRADWSVELSREVLESCLDPHADLFVQGPDPRDHSGTRVLWHAFSVCDPVGGMTYEIDEMKLANFVGPAYFDSANPASPTDFLRSGVRPFRAMSKGYISAVEPESLAWIEIAAREMLDQSDEQAPHHYEPRSGVIDRGQLREPMPDRGVILPRPALLTRTSRRRELVARQAAHLAAPVRETSTNANGAVSQAR